MMRRLRRKKEGLEPQGAELGGTKDGLIEIGEEERVRRWLKKVVGRRPRQSGSWGVNTGVGGPSSEMQKRIDG